MRAEQTTGARNLNGYLQLVFDCFVHPKIYSEIDISRRLCWAAKKRAKLVDFIGTKDPTSIS